MLKLNEYQPIKLPKYVICEELSKASLRKICLADNELKLYLPDSPNVECIQREFYLSVIFSFYIS